MTLTELLQSDRPLIMGVLNVTPDSFSDGGRHDDDEAALTRARTMLTQGADIIDVGGESTRPGAQRIDADQQRQRVIPVIEQLTQSTPPVVISIDTTLAPVARAALDAGAQMVNDVSAGCEDDAMLPLIAERRCHVTLMHMRGSPATMQNDPTYNDVVAEVLEFLLARADAARAAGVDRDKILIDPGIGFGKTTDHNLQLLADLGRFVATGYPVLLGASRKRFLGELTGVTEPVDRVHATAATTAWAVSRGVRAVRVHDIQPNRHAADVTAAIVGHRKG